MTLANDCLRISSVVCGFLFRHEVAPSLKCHSQRLTEREILVNLLLSALTYVTQWSMKDEFYSHAKKCR
ncbi:hypothetical protein SK128_001145 [Halocaridina rubra]|uniref:Uncharacterized protein n=1 Tax=Halocaridina rubra TaxID=373956 RepID=A0AAN9AF23_HALRR